MTTRERGARRMALRWAILLGAPLLVWIVGSVVAVRVTQRGATAERLTPQRDRAIESFRKRMDEAGRLVRTALLQSPERARSAARQSVWRDRLEGVGVVGSDHRYLDWLGFPPEPESLGGPSERTHWELRVEGLHARLLVRSAAAADGSYALGSFVVDSSLRHLRFEDLVPRAAGALRDVEFLDASRDHSDLIEVFGETASLIGGGESPTVYVPLRAPDDSVLAIATLQQPRVEFRAKHTRGIRDALAATTLTLLLLLLFDWRRRCLTPLGLLTTWGILLLGRALLLLTHAPDYLLWHQVSSPALYGTSQAFGLLASPADLVLTTLTMLGIVLAARRFCASAEARAGVRGFVVAGATATVSVGVLLLISVSLARHGTVAGQLFERADQPLAQFALLLGLVLCLVAAAEATATLLLLAVRRGRPRVTYWPARVVVALALVPLAAASTSIFLNTADQLARERVRTEFAAEVQEQRARRRLALRAAVLDAARSEAALQTLQAPVVDGFDYTAYRLWVASELFQIGYRSSLDLYDAEGVLISHFGFDLPPLDEIVDAAEAPGAVEQEERYPAAPGVEQGLLHVEAPIVSNGVRLGTVVGHVLDEPHNLPFLPSARPYLQALGPGARAENTPDYVLYDAQGALMLSTLAQPPPPDPEAWLAAGPDEFARIRSADQRFDGLALRDGDRLHLLLLRTRPWLDRMAILAKLFLMGVAALALLALVRSLRQRRGPLFLITAVRESFYRRLLTTLLLASLAPLIGLAVFLGGYFEGRAESQLDDSAARLIRVVRHVIRDYGAVQQEDPAPSFNDEVLYWLRDVVEQEIHLYEDELLVASSKRELFDSGLLPLRLPGEAYRAVVQASQPHLVLSHRLGLSTVPVAYTRVELPQDGRRLVAAVPLVLQQKETERAAERVEEMLILTTVLLAVLLILATALLARTVARPIRELVGATARIASGDYSARLKPTTQDEMAELVEQFNVMASALARQRADLERRRDYIEALLTNATTGVISTDAAGRIVTLNPAAAELLGGAFSADDIGELLNQVVAREQGLEPLARALQRPSPPAAEPAEVDLARDGEPLRLRYVRVPLPDPSGGPSGFLILLDDVTDLMRSNQLAAWAEMARAIAHEIKNPLTPIQLATEHLQRLLADRDITPSATIDACIETVMKQVAELRKIAAEFSAYSKLPAMSPQPIDPVGFMREVAQPYRTSPPSEVRVVEEYQPSPPMLADRRVLTRGVVNLIENALQAMSDEGGTLLLSVRPGRNGEEVVISVEDSGPGLAPDVRARLFEPYFSTKSSGTGLGLAIAQRAVEGHGGHIEVDSEPGRGAAFRIHLPAAAVQPADAARR